MPLSRAEITPALALLTDPGSLRAPRGFAALADEARAIAGSWAHGPGVRGFGIASRRAGGVDTGEPALKVYVERKLPREALACPAPREIRVPWLRTPVPVDVEELGPLRLHHGLQSLVRPALPGCAISVKGRGFGTLGCRVRAPVKGGPVYLLSAAHVIANYAIGPAGLEVMQPGTGSTPGSAIAHLAQWGKFTYSHDTFPNLFDAAIAAVKPEVVPREIYGIGQPVGFTTLLPKGLTVQKCGAATGCTSGKIIDPHFSCYFHFPQKDGSFARAGFRNQVLCSARSDIGDSGAAVLDMKGNVLGVLIGGSEGHTVFSPIGPILQAFGVTID